MKMNITCFHWEDPRDAHTRYLDEHTTKPEEKKKRKFLKIRKAKK